MIRYWPFGPHGTTGNYLDGIGAIWRDLNARQVPCFYKGVDGYGPIYELMQIGDQYGVENQCVFRLGSKDGILFGVPNWYANSPEDAAAQHVALTLAHLPPEFDKRVWLEIINEPDKDEDVGLGWTPEEYASWLGYFSLEAAKLLNAIGIKHLAYGYSSGEPELSDYLTEGQLAYLRYCADNHDRAGIAVHEYSYNEDVCWEDGWLVGRFKKLFDLCDAAGIRRPKVAVTEFGWTLWIVPDPDVAMPQLLELANKTYGPYPEIIGAAIWHYGSGWKDIKFRAHKLLAPMHEIAKTWRLEVDEIMPEPCNGAPRLDYRRLYHVLKQDATVEQLKFVADLAYPRRETIGFSWDDAMIGDLSNKTAVMWELDAEEIAKVKTFRDAHYPGTKLEFRYKDAPTTPPPPPTGGTKLDLKPYFYPDAAYGPIYELRRPDGSQERVQHQHANGVLFITKGTAGRDGKSEWEELYADGAHIWRGLDTSPGGGRFYRQYELNKARAKWCARYMAEGETFYGPGHHVQFYYKDDCRESSANSGYAQNVIRFVKRHPALVFNGIEVRDVIELSQPGGERWFFARGLGMVAWQSQWGSSSISEIHSPGSRPNNQREVLPCSFA